MTTFTVPPPVCPYAASLWKVSTFTSATASGGGLYETRRLRVVSGEPSISSSLLWFGAPPIEKPLGPELSNGRENLGSEFGVTPYASCASTSGARPLIGMFSIWRVLITWPVDADAVSSIEASAETVTD